MTAPNHTTLFAAVVLKFVPVIVTVLPTEPETGAKETIVGGTATPIVFRNSEMELPFVFATARSGLPSPSRSPMLTPHEPNPLVKSTFAANEPAPMEPEVPVFLNTETEPAVPE